MTALTDALAAIDNEPAEPLHAAIARGLMAGYDAQWARDSFYIVRNVEQCLEGPIVNPGTNHNAHILSQAGKLDVVVQREGRLILIDHKTTSQDISDPNSPYWRQLVVDSQVSHYMLLGWLNETKFDDAIWDVIRKPGIRPKKLNKSTRNSVLSFQKYCDRTISRESLIAMQSEERETPEMFEARLVSDIAERPERYFQRRSVPRIDAELLEYAAELWQHQKDLLHERKRELPTRNPGACMLYGTPCQFLGVCSGHDQIDSDRWKKKEKVHPELPVLKRDEHDVLTHSRIRTFQTCRRKHFYQYELGVERHDAEDSEALVFGQLMHVALEAWWLFFKEPNNGESSGSPAIEVGEQQAVNAC